MLCQFQQSLSMKKLFLGMTYPGVEFVTLFTCVSNVCGLDVIENESTVHVTGVFYFNFIFGQRME